MTIQHHHTWQHHHAWPARREGFTLIELLVVIAMIAVLVALSLPALTSMREMARRGQCQHNLASLGLAVTQYEAIHQRFPAGSIPVGSSSGGSSSVGSNTVDTSGAKSGAAWSWTVSLLPFLDQRAIATEIDYDISPLDERFASVSAMHLAPFLCPSNNSEPLPGAGPCDYLATHHHRPAPLARNNSGLLFLESAVQLSDIADGLQSTLLLAETSDRGPRSYLVGDRSTLRHAEAHNVRSALVDIGYRTDIDERQRAIDFLRVRP